MANVISPVPRTRPGTVSAAGALLFAAAALLIVDAIVGVISVLQERKAIPSIGLDPDIERAMHTVLGIAAGATAVIYVILAIVLIITAGFVLRGRQGWRITAWVLTGLDLVCGFCGLAGLTTTFTSTSSGSISTVQMDQIKDSVPNWARVLSPAIGALMALTCIAIIILLAVPTSNAYFRQAPPEINLAYPAYPGYPPYQAYPSYPTAPGAPPQPMQPQPPQPQQQPPQQQPPSGPGSPPSGPDQPGGPAA